MADVLGRPVHPCPEPEGSLRGAALFALEKLGIEPQPMKFGEPYDPRPQIHAAYLGERRKQERLEKRM